MSLSPDGNLLLFQVRELKMFVEFRPKTGRQIAASKDLETVLQSDVWLTVHRNSVWIRKTN